MPRWGKRKGGEASDDGGEPARKNARKDSNDSDSITVCEISKSRKVSVKSWHGKIMVDIREFYMKDGEELPGKKGISLTLDQWNILRAHVEEIDKVLAAKA